MSETRGKQCASIGVPGDGEYEVCEVVDPKVVIPKNFKVARDIRL